MKRGLIGSYEESVVSGEVVRAFVPEPLPPTQEIVFDAKLQQRLEQRDQLWWGLERRRRSWS